MRIARFGPPENEKTCIVTKEGKRLDCSKQIEEWGPSELANLDALNLPVADLPVVDEAARWAAPIPRPGKIICIGLNYADHAEESGMPIPEEPIVFMKAPNTVVGPYDDVLIPRGSEKTDWEVELAFVVGKETRYLASPENAAAHIAGYCICHDVSERAFQLERGGQWDKGKSCDTFCPLGPWLASAEELGDVNKLDMSLDVNGERRQSGSTKTLIFNCHVVLHYLSQFMTLEAGDVITTGTPPGVGLGMKPPQYLKAGDVVELSIEGLGTQRQTCKQA